MTTEITDVFGAEISEAIGKIGSLTCKVQRSLLPDILTIHEVGFERDEEGEIFRGYAQPILVDIDENGVEIATLVIAGREIELEWANSDISIQINNQSAFSALNTILADTGWTGQLIGTGFVNVTTTYTAQSIWACLLDFAIIQNAFLRVDRQNRIVQIRKTAQSTGIELVHNSVTVPNSQGLISGIREQRKPIEYNRVIPRGEQSGNIAFDIRYSTRTSPYSIQYFTKKSPKVINTISGSFTGSDPSTPTTAPQHILDVPRNGMVIIHLYGGTSWRPHMDGAFFPIGDGWTATPELYQLISIDNKSPGVSDPQDAVYIYKKLSEGEHEFRLATGHDNTGTVHYLILMVEGHDALFVESLETSWEQASSTTLHTTPSLSNHIQGSLLLGFIRLGSARDISSGAGQTREFGAGSTNRIVDSRIDATKNMSWSWPLATTVASAMTLDIRSVRTYYIEDAASIAAFSLQPYYYTIASQKLLGETPIILENAATTLYDLAATLLMRAASVHLSRDFDIAYLPFSDWLVSDSMEYQSEILISTERKQIFDPTGIRLWQVKLSTVPAFESTFFDTVKQIREEVNSLKLAVT